MPTKDKTEGLMDFLSRQASTLPEEVIHVESWARDITLRGLSARERDEFEATNLRRANAQGGNGAGRARSGGRMEPDLRNFRARLVARHIVEGGMRTFSNERGEEILGDQPAAVLDKLFTVARRLSGFSDEDVAELEKNLEPTAESEPNSDLPPSSGARSPS